MAGLRCFYHYKGQKLPNQIILSETESNHLIKVRRAQINDLVSIFDGKGNEWECRLYLANSKKAVLKVRSHHIETVSPSEITLAQGLPKGKTMDTIVQKAVELGAHKIVPLVTANSEFRVSKDRAKEKVKKWYNVAIEACKQSGNSFLPEIDPIIPISLFCKSLQKPALKFIASLSDRAVSLSQALREQKNENNLFSRPTIILVGPEGDYTSKEHDLACKNGFIPITLGKSVLRSDTAAIVALALLNNELHREK